MKKKLLSSLLATSLALCGLCATTTAYEDSKISVVLNGQLLKFPVEPTIIEGRTMVPMRTIFEELGFEVSWNQDTRSIVAYSPATNLMVGLWIDNYEMIAGDYTDINSGIVNDTSFILDVPPQIIDGSTLVPVRAISEASRCEVLWDNNTKTVKISTPYNIGSGTEEEIKDYLRYNYPIIMIDSAPQYMRFNVLHNFMKNVSADYIIVSIPVGTVRELAFLDEMLYSNEEKQQIVDAYSSFEQKLGKDLISQLSGKKIWGFVANDIGSKYSYFNWTNYKDYTNFNYGATKATNNFYWAEELNYGNFDYEDYFADIKIENLPITKYNSLYDKETTVTKVEFGETNSTNKGKEDDEIFVDITVTADGGDFFYLNYYNKKGKLLSSSSIYTYDGSHTYLELVPKDTAKVVITEERMD